ncbi:hypothetical protein HHI36_006299, partial [Cryptolaemus montrouzieri]
LVGCQQVSIVLDPVHILRTPFFALSDCVLENKMIRYGQEGNTYHRQMFRDFRQGSALCPFLYNLVFEDLLQVLYSFSELSMAYADDLMVLVLGDRALEASAQSNFDGIHKQL